MSEMNEMSCAMLADAAAELALGVLTGRERADAIEHLDRCETCREDVRKLMATGDELLGLLPLAEPPAGFETRVLGRLGLLAPGLPAPSALGRAVTIPMVAERGLADRRPSGHRRPSARRSGRPASRPRQLLATAAVAIAIAGAGIGGWGMRVATTPASAFSVASSATLMSASHQRVGHVWASSGSDGKLVTMSVDLEHGNELVTCQVIGSDGKVVDLGAVTLDRGYGSWQFAVRGLSGALSGARVVGPDGTVLASATF
jgi:hypothetical protein